MRKTQSVPGFTLIELLVVVAIIAILAAIAIPNLLEAQTRSKTARAKAEMRSVATAIETYRVDNNHYPHGIIIQGTNPREQANWGFLPESLTTPIGYMTSLPFDQFGANYRTGELDHLGTSLNIPPHHPHTRYRFEERQGWTGVPGSTQSPAQQVVDYEQRMDRLGFARSTPFILSCLGPDITEDVIPNYNPMLYDTTNGTVSRGDILYASGGGILK